jgi:hypothetical protein
MGIVFYDVEVCAWPERGDLLVIDPSGKELLAQYLPMADIKSDIVDIYLPYEKRAAHALRSLENDQDLLRNYYLTDDAVCLRLENSQRKRIAELLGKYNLSLSDSDFDALAKTKEILNDMKIDDLFSLLVDWHDLVERRMPFGTSYSDQSSWVHRAAPGVERHFSLLVDRKDEDMPYELFSMLVDVAKEEFSFGLFLRWLYFHRTEFRQHRAERPKALR